MIQSENLVTVGHAAGQTNESDFIGRCRLTSSVHKISQDIVYIV